MSPTRSDQTEEVVIELDRHAPPPPLPGGQHVAADGADRGPAGAVVVRDRFVRNVYGAHRLEGSARMLNNDALDDDEVAEGWVLTCQSLPTSRQSSDL